MREHLAFQHHPDVKFQTSYPNEQSLQCASRQSVLFGTCVCVRRKGVYELSRQQLSLLSTVLCDIFEVSFVGVIIATCIYLVECDMRIEVYGCER